MVRRLTAAVFVAAAIAVVAASTVKAEQPDGVMCKHPKGKIFRVFIPKGGNMGDAVQACLDMGGHPAGVFVDSKGESK
jgi:hypothetical protein